MGYRDQAWCASDCVNGACFRCFTPTHRAKAVEWWGGEDFQITMANFQHGCPIYLAPPLPPPTPEEEEAT